MGSRTRSLQLKVMYCKDLRAFNFFQKLSVYAVVSILSDEEKLELLPQQRQRQKTSTDTEGDGSPEWNHEMRFDLGLGGHDDDDHLFLHFDLRYELAVFGDKSLGEVRVPLKDLINEGESIVRFVNYEVRNSDGKPNGVLNFSYKVLNDAYNGGGGDGDSPMKNNINAHIHGYPIVNPINNHHQISDDDQSHKPFAADVNCSSLFPSSQVHYASPPPEEYLQIPSAQSQESYYPAVAAAPHHQVHYPSLETPYSTLAEVGYTDYPPPPVHQFHYLPPPPPPPRPPPPPPHHHHHHHHPPHHHRRPPHHRHGGQGAVYHSPSPWLYEHPYPRPPDSLGGDYAYVPYGMHSTYNTGGDRPNHCWTVGGIP